MKFNFTGEVSYNDETSKVPFYRKIEGKASGAAINLICIEGKNNRAFLEMAGFINKKIQTRSTDNKQIEIDWEDRLDEDSLKKVASFRKHVITLDGDRHEFISEYDFVNFVKDHIDEIKGKRYLFTGQVKKNVYQGKISDRFQIQNMYEVTDDSKKNALMVTGDFYFSKDSIDAADWKEKKLYLNGWTSEYAGKDKPNDFYPRQIVFDCSKIDFDTDSHVKILNYRLKQIGLSLDANNGIASKLKKNKYYKIAIICKYVNGNSEIEFSENDLTQNQLESISLGLATLDDYRPKGQIYGNRVTMFRYKDFDLREDYANGCIDATDEFDEDRIFSPSAEETVEEAFKENAMNAPEEMTADELFD